VVKAQELRMSMEISAILKEKEEEEARFQTPMLESKLEEQLLLVKERKLNMMLMQATLRVQLLKEKKLKLEVDKLGEEERGKVARFKDAHHGDGDGDNDDDDKEEDDFFTAD
jgi:hypothetical protein